MIDDDMDIAWINLLTKIQLKEELQDRVQMIATLRRHRDALLDIIADRSEGEKDDD
jgi:hypothetical protein|tara:strand:- start:457 stop:624 length:168 start_codon:yes stop_codon:yes gene_type:complete